MIARPPYGLLAAAAVSLLPGWARWPLRLPRLPVAEAAVVRPAGQAVVHGHPLGHRRAAQCRGQLIR